MRQRSPLGVLCGEQSSADGNGVLESTAGGVRGISYTGFLFLHLGFGGGTDVDDGHTTCALGKALLELLAVVVGGGFVARRFISLRLLIFFSCSPI